MGPSVVFIDLGYERGEPPTYGSPTRATVSHWFPIAVVSALILMFATASAAPPRSPLTELMRVAAGPSDGFALTGDDQLLAQSFGRLSSYDLATRRVLWRAGQASPSYRLRTADGLVLMRPLTTGAEAGTTAVSATTGAARWQRAGDVVTVSGSPALLAVSDVPGVNRASAGRRIQGTVDAVDPMTGATDWTVVVPGAAVLIGVPGPGDEGGRMLLLRIDGRATVYDVYDGRALISADLPDTAGYGPDNPAVAGGMILLRHSGALTPEISAYDPSTLKQAWTIPAPDALDMAACGDIVCLSGNKGMQGLDPATGDILWTRPGWTTVEQQGQVFVAYGGPEGYRPLGVIDPDSGALQVQLDGWRPVTGTGGDDQLLVTRADDSGARTMVAVARPGDAQPRLLAQLPAGTGDCQAASGRLACRSMYGELVVWAYRTEG